MLSSVVMVMGMGMLVGGAMKDVLGFYVAVDEGGEVVVWCGGGFGVEAAVEE